MRRSRSVLAPVVTLLLLSWGLEQPASAANKLPGQSAHPVRSVQDTETAAQRDARMAWWREARFGMFIHWGLYSIPAGIWDGKPVPGTGEWIMNSASIPVAPYKALSSQFNPTGFSAHDIVALAKAAGMRYIVVTTKHHEGFAMFASKADPFNIVDATPYHHDVLRELAEECRKQGMKLGFYYSQDQDWTAPGGAALKTGDHQPPTFHWDPAQNGSFADYLHRKAIPQIKELLSSYGDSPSVLWFDTPTSDMTPELAGEIVALLNRYPKLIWNNRLGGGYDGDTETPEQSIPAEGFPGRDWESCMTINDTWGYKAEDRNFKSTATLLWNLIDIASKGGNYLLNIGPDSHGQVPSPEKQRLLAMGKWLQVNGQAIYGTSASVIGVGGADITSSAEQNASAAGKQAQRWGWRSTTSPSSIYIEIFRWSHAPLHIATPPRKIVSAYLLADPLHRRLRMVASADGIDLTLPEEPLDPLATVVVLKTQQCSADASSRCAAAPAQANGSQRAREGAQ